MRKYIVDTRKCPFNIQEVELISETNMGICCSLDGIIFEVKKGSFFDEKILAEEKLKDIIFIGEYKSRKKIRKYNGWKCEYCGRVIYNRSEVTVDHIIPKSKGGQTIYSNLAISCSKCNEMKSSKHINHYKKLLDMNSKKKLQSPNKASKKIRYSAHNKHGRNIETIARMDRNTISINSLGNYTNLVDKVLNKG